MSRTTLLSPFLVFAFLAGCQAVPAAPVDLVTFKNDSYTGADSGVLPSSLLTTSDGRAPSGSRSSTGSTPTPTSRSPSRLVSRPPSPGTGAPLDPNLLNMLLNTMNGNTPGPLPPPPSAAGTTVVGSTSVAVPAARTSVSQEALVPVQSPIGATISQPTPAIQVSGKIHRPEVPNVVTASSGTGSTPAQAVSYASGMSPDIAAKMRAAVPSK